MAKIEAKKRFGQNFLKDSTVLDKIIQSMPYNERKLIEIGPGLGDLTRLLLEVKPLRAYEVDRDLCVHLKDKFHKEIEKNKLELIQKNILESLEEGTLCKEPYDLVANLIFFGHGVATQNGRAILTEVVSIAFECFFVLEVLISKR